MEKYFQWREEKKIWFIRRKNENVKIMHNFKLKLKNFNVNSKNFNLLNRKVLTGIETFFFFDLFLDFFFFFFFALTTCNRIK